MSDFEKWWNENIKANGSSSYKHGIWTIEEVAQAAFQAGRESMREEAAGVADRFTGYESSIDEAFISKQRIEVSQHIAKAIREIE